MLVSAARRTSCNGNSLGRSTLCWQRLLSAEIGSACDPHFTADCTSHATYQQLCDQLSLEQNSKLPMWYVAYAGSIAKMSALSYQQRAVHHAMGARCIGCLYVLTISELGQ